MDSFNNPFLTRANGFWGDALQLGIILLAVLFWSLPATALTNQELEERVRVISHQLRCPTCQAMSVKESEAGLSVNMKSKIREMLEEGKSDDEIVAFFVERYGEWILRSPKKEGFNLILWLTPLVLIIGAGVFVVRYLLKQSRRKVSSPVAPLTPQEKKAIENDLDRFRSDISTPDT